MADNQPFGSNVFGGSPGAMNGVSILEALKSMRGENAAKGPTSIGGVPLGPQGKLSGFKNSGESVEMPDFAAPDVSGALSEGASRAESAVSGRNREEGLSLRAAPQMRGDEGGESDIAGAAGPMGFDPRILGLARALAPNENDRSTALMRAGIGMAEAGSHGSNFLSALASGAGTGMDYFQKLRAFRADQAMKMAQFQRESELNQAQIANYKSEAQARLFPYQAGGIMDANGNFIPEGAPQGAGAPVTSTANGPGMGSVSLQAPGGGARPPAFAGPAPGGGPGPGGVAAAPPMGAPNPATAPVGAPPFMDPRQFNMARRLQGVPGAIGEGYRKQIEDWGKNGYYGTDGKWHFMQGSPGSPEQQAATAGGVARAQEAAHIAAAGPIATAQENARIAAAGPIAAAQEAAKAPYTFVQRYNDKTGRMETVPVADIARPGGGAPGGGGGDTLTPNSMPSGPMPDQTAHIEAARKLYDKMPDSNIDMEQHQQRLETVSHLLEKYQTGRWAEHKANILADLRATGMDVKDTDTASPEAFEIFTKSSTKDLADMMKAAGNRPLVLEMQSFSKAIQNPELQPGANKYIVGQSLGLIDWQKQFNKDFGSTYSEQHGVVDPEKFSEAWVQAHPLSSYVQRRLDSLPVAGVDFEKIPIGGLGIAQKATPNIHKGEKYVKVSEENFVPLREYLVNKPNE